ncbi:50S ribosomal protein L30 [Candidatus Woesearchaeota archaeon]|jgi:large subunit ribosomal protein L30|nr:50S ribosomal protein L30 [Candidatus Woesearchaeota archaeon]
MEEKQVNQTEKQEIKKQKPQSTKDSKEVLLAVIRIRGCIGITGSTRDTLEMLKLHRKNFCVILKSTPSLVGMIKKAKDYITWGEIDESLLKELIEKRGEPNPKDKSRTKSYFRLHPPRKGYGRKGIKKTFTVGGGLGYRGDKINDLIKRML